MEPLVSVIIAAYNAEKTIGPAVRSILGQTYHQWELIIVDDASRDRTAEIVASFSDPRIRLIRNKVNLKQGLARNIAINHSRGEFIAVQDADDLSMPTRLADQVQFLLTHPEVDIVGSNAYLVNLNGQIKGVLVTRGTSHQQLTSKIAVKSPLIHPTIMGRSNWFKKYLYRHYPRSQDQDLFLRSYRKSIFANLPKYLYAYFDPGNIPMKKLILASWTNLIMRFRHHREYGLPARKVLIYPLILGGKWLYWCLLALRGKSIFDPACRQLPQNEQVQRDQEWIYQCLGK